MLLMLARYIQTDFTFFFLFWTDHAHKGNLYTLFLHSPMSAFCFVTNVVDIPIHLWDKCLAYIDRFMTEASRLVTRCRGVGKLEIIKIHYEMLSNIWRYVLNQYIVALKLQFILLVQTVKWCFVFLYCIPSIVRDKYLNRNVSVGHVWAPAGRSEGKKLRVSRRQLIRRDTAVTVTVTRTACVRVLDTAVHNETPESSSGSLRLCTSHRQSRDREDSQTEGIIC